MDAKLKAEWIAALRSGEYRQGLNYLHDSERNTFCCLGVLCRVAGVSIDDIRDVISTDTPCLDSGIDKEMRSYLGDTLNDGQGKTFSEIADYIESEIPADAKGAA
jgi:hypothetical protein